MKKKVRVIWTEQHDTFVEIEEGESAYDAALELPSGETMVSKTLGSETVKEYLCDCGEEINEEDGACNDCKREAYEQSVLDAHRGK